MIKPRDRLSKSEILSLMVELINSETLEDEQRFTESGCAIIAQIAADARDTRLFAEYGDKEPELFEVESAWYIFQYLIGKMCNAPTASHIVAVVILTIPFLDDAIKREAIT